MKTLLFLSLFISCIFASTAQVGINTATPDASAILDIKATDKGMLVPRMTEVQKMAISTPATSLLVYQTDGTTPGFYYYNGSSWVNLTAVGADKIDDLTDGKTTTNSLFLGENVGATETAGFRKNTSVGIISSQSITTGLENTAFGYSALRQVTTGSTNTAIGSFALNSTQNGAENVAAGRNTLFSNLSGSSNAAIGANALYTNTTGGFNNAMGSQSLNRNTTGTGNNAMGSSSLFNNTTGADNVAIGRSALSSNTASSSSVAVGTNALLLFNSASAIPKNTAVGTNSFRSTTTGTNNTGVGYNSAYSNTTGINNTAIGSEALYSSQTISNTVAVGYNALRSTTTGANNTGIGSTSLYSNTTGFGNTALGYESLYNNTIGAGNTAIGGNSYNENTAGNNNVSVGENSGRYVDGNNNVFVGRRAGANNFIANPSNNKSNNIMIGYEAGFDQLVNNRLFIENSSSVNPLIYGEFDNDMVRINGELQIGNPSTTGYVLSNVDGTAGQVMTTDGFGAVTFQTVVGDGTGTDDQILTISGHNLSIEDGNTIMLPDNDTTYDGSDFALSNQFVPAGQFVRGISVTGTLLAGSDSDSQVIDQLALSGTTLQISLQNDGQAPQTVNLASLQDGIGTDDQNLTTPTLSGTTLNLGIENGTGTSINLSSLQDGTGTDDQTIDQFSLSGTTLQLSLEDDGQAPQTVNLASLQDGIGTDDQNLTTPTLSGTTLNLGIENGTGTSINLSSLQDGNTQNTLDQAYDEGGTGVGRSITASNGAVLINGNDGFQNTGTFGSGATMALSGSGTKMFFYPRKAAFRAGFVNGAQWNDANIGNYSTAFGFNNTASGIRSVAFGNNNTTSGDGSVAFGSSNNVVGFQSFAFGSSNDLSGDNGAAFGEGNNASGYSNLLAGINNTSSGESSIAMGQDNDVAGDISLAFGSSNTANSSNSVAIGTNLEAFSAYETVMGVNSTNYSPASTIAFNANDRLFAIGNGTSTAARSNALTIYKDGRMNINDAYTMPTTDGTVNQVLTTDGSGTASWQNPTSPFELKDPKYPDGFSGMTPITMNNLSTTTYTVPAGKNVYITNVLSSGGSITLQISGTAVLGGIHNVGNYEALTNPLIGGSGDVISSSDDSLVISGFLVNANVTPITMSTNPSYTVPANKILVILNSRNAIFRINGITIYNGNGNQQSATGLTSFHNPIFLDEGQLFGNLNGTMNGYLIDK